MNRSIIIGTFLFIAFGCGQDKNMPALEKPENQISLSSSSKLSLNKELLYDKVLGMLLGSAIGDAMGAPTEMWTRSMIKTEYGHVSRLEPMVRAPSPEGTWKYNLPAGGTTDDTRWKILLADYLKGTGNSPLKASTFAHFIVNRYEKDIDTLKLTESFDPEPFEAQMRKISWLQEWALVAHAYSSDDITTYSNAINRFYGGEMVCAGLLFSPVIGVYQSGNPEAAYAACYEIDIFDLGFAKDISALTAAMVAAAIPASATPDSILQVIRNVDPHHYFKSRLVGRMAHQLLQQAQTIVYEAKQTKIEEIFDDDYPPVIPANSKHDSLYHAQLEKAYQLLELRNQTMPFHASEIYLVNLTALLYSNFDFQQSIEFVVNYGRDNDTTAAVTGAILGAYHGAGKLPKPMVEEVIKANLALGIDLEKVAQQLVETILS